MNLTTKRNVIERRYIASKSYPATLQKSNYFKIKLDISKLFAIIITKLIDKVANQGKEIKIEKIN